MAHTTDITASDFQSTIDQGGIALVDFWAPWCGPCRAFGPIYEDVAAANPDIVFAKVNTEAEPELAGALNIQAIPTLMAFRDGILVFRQPGMLPAPALTELVAKLRDLDMTQVRAQVARQAQTATA